MRRGGLALALCIVAGAWPVHAAPYRVPHLSWGAPDLEGVWSNASLTSLVRRAATPDLVVKEADVPAMERRIAAMIDNPDGDTLGQGLSEWSDASHLGRINGQARTSWIVEPADGRVPYTSEGQARMARQQARLLGAFANPEDRPNSERCVAASGATAGPPLINHKYGSSLQIVQSPDAVAIYAEMNHDVRVIRLNSTHLPPSIRPWMGDSIGHWEGETLVVETTNFNAADSDRGSYYMSPDAVLVERFTRTSPTEIRYDFTVSDPTIYRQPWRAEMTFHPGGRQVFEYACHEGNYSARGILAGARRAEALKGGN